MKRGWQPRDLGGGEEEMESRLLTTKATVASGVKASDMRKKSNKYT